MPGLNQALLDSQLIISFLRGNKTAFDVFWAVRKKYVAVATIGEFATGLYRAKNLDRAMEQFAKLFQLLTVLPATVEIAIQFGLFESQLLKKGTPIPKNDVWIASTAKIHQLPVITNDSHFLLLPQIQVINW